MKVKRKVKKLIALVFVIIVVLIVMLIVKKASYVEQSEMLDKVINGIDNLNYSYNMSDGKEVIVVGKKAKIIGTLTEEYVNYETNETYINYIGMEYSELNDNNGISDMQYYKDYIAKYFDLDSGYNYSYEGKKDGFWIVKFKAKGQSKNISSITFYINENNGVIEKAEYIKNGTSNVVEENFDYTSENYLETEVTVTNEILSYKDAPVDTNG